MTIEIPVWVLWLIGVPAGLFLTAFAFVGVILVWAWFFGR